MAEIIHGGGEEHEPHRKQRPLHSDYVYRGKQENLREHGVHGHKVNARKAELEGGHHRRSNINGKPFTWEDFIAFHGDHIGLIPIGFLIPGRKKKHARKRR